MDKPDPRQRIKQIIISASDELIDSTSIFVPFLLSFIKSVALTTFFFFFIVGFSGDNGVMGALLMAFVMAIYAIPISFYLGFPGFFLGLLIAISLHRRAANKLWQWVASGILVALLTNFGTYQLGWLAITFYTFCGALCAFFVWWDLTFKRGTLD